MHTADLARFPRDRLLAVRATAEKLLHANVWRLESHPDPVLCCGQEYPGIWLEHNQDCLFYLAWDPHVARASNDIFIRHQAADGLLPPYLRRAANPPMVGDGHVQSVLPLARCALEVAQACADDVFLQRSYRAAVAYDAWLGRYRDTRGTGLVEMFCEYDTGHDHSPRVTDGGIPRACPGMDARVRPDSATLPIISADLSAMRYGAQVALAHMADALGLAQEAMAWRDHARAMRQRIHELLWDEVDEFFYDLAPDGSFRRYRSEHITRLFLNRVVDQRLFERIWQRHFTDPQGFATEYPIPSLAPSDPRADRDGRENSWGGQSQALTILRAALWMEEYGRSADLERMLAIWLEAIIDQGCTFAQEMHPRTGRFSSCAPNYTPTLLITILAIDRLVIAGGTLSGPIAGSRQGIPLA